MKTQETCELKMFVSRYFYEMKNFNSNLDIKGKVLHRLKEHFEKFLKENIEIQPTNKETDMRIVTPTQDEIKNAIQELKNYKKPHESGITTEMLKTWAE